MSTHHWVVLSYAIGIVVIWFITLWYRAYWIFNRAMVFGGVLGVWIFSSAYWLACAIENHAQSNDIADFAVSLIIGVAGWCAVAQNGRKIDDSKK